MKTIPLPADLTSATDAPSEALSDEPSALPQKAAGPGRQRRIWALALGTAAVWGLDPALGEMAEMIASIACTNNKSMARDAIAQMRSKADSLCTHIAPLPAGALSRVVRRAEAACGAVLDKGVRVREVEASWDAFMACLKTPRDPAACLRSPA